MATNTLGQTAEAAVADRLAAQGYKILNRNWKTKVCELDIVARKKQAVYFVEVKYRGSSSQGSGLEYITPKKLNQIKFAARHWNQQHDWNGDYRIIGAEVSGLNFEDVKIIEID